MSTQRKDTLTPNIIQEENNYQVGRIGSFKISFRTMPRDLEFLLKKEKTGQAKVDKQLDSKLINIAPEPPISTLKFEQAEDLPSYEKQKEESLLFEADKEIAKKTQIKIGKREEKDTDKILSQATKKSQKNKAALLYKEAKSLYNRRFYDEAMGKFSEVLKINPGHWRAKWFSDRAKKNLENSQKTAEKEQLKLIEKLKLEQEKEKDIASKLKIEEKAKIEAEVRDRVGKELEELEKERAQAITAVQKAQADLEKIRQEATEKARQEFTQKLQIEEEQIRQEQEARKKIANELVLAQQEKNNLEGQVRQEHEALIKAQQIATAATEQLSASLESKPKISEPQQPRPAYAAPLTETSPPAYPSPAYQPYAPGPIITPSAETLEIKPGIVFLLVKQLKILFSLKIAKIIGLILVIGTIGSSVIYFTGLYKIISSRPPEKPAPSSYSEEIFPAPLFSVDQTETIVLTAGQKKNLFQELNKISEKNQKAGSFNRILIKITNQDQEQKYASLIDLIDSLQIALPSELLSNLDNSYTLFFYSQKELPDSPFLAGLGKNKLGLTIAFRQKDKLAQQFSDWEKNMPTDLDTIFLGKKISFGSDRQFQEILYDDTLIHSLDLPNQYSSLSYAFFNNKVLITTSQESIKALIDKLSSSH